MIGAAAWSEHPSQRLVRCLYSTWVATLPILSASLMKLGQVPATVENGVRLLRVMLENRALTTIAWYIIIVPVFDAVRHKITYLPGLYHVADFILALGAQAHQICSELLQITFGTQG